MNTKIGVVTFNKKKQLSYLENSDLIAYFSFMSLNNACLVKDVKVILNFCRRTYCLDEQKVVNYGYYSNFNWCLVNSVCKMKINSKL